MITIREINDFMSTWAPRELSESWDNDGIMLCRDENEKIDRVLVALEINDKVLSAAENNGARLIITHHPFIFHPIKHIDGTMHDELSTLLKNDISVLSYHTRLDRAEGGVNDTLAQKLGLSEISPFGDGMGRLGVLEKTMCPKEFAEYVSSILGCGKMRVSRTEKDKNISRVAVLGGGGKDEIPLAATVADAFVTADLSHNAFITANELSLFVVDAGHYHTENPITEKIAERLGKAFPTLSIFTADSESPFEIM